MSNDSITIHNEAAAEALAQFSQANAKAEREARQAAQMAPATRIATSTKVVLNGGQVQVAGEQVTRAQIEAQPLPTGMVRLANGMVTSLEVAEAAGMMAHVVEGGEPRGFKQEAPNQIAPKAASGNESKGQDSGGEVGGGDPIAKATDALNKVTEALGTETVQSLQQDVVASGEMPSELPHGVTQDMADAVVAGYTAQADAVLKDTGANVETMLAMLSDNELADARVSVFTNNDVGLQALGREAAGRLQTLPEHNPALLKELTANWPAEAKIVQRGRDTWVETPGWKMPWAAAVRAGKIKF